MQKYQHLYKANVKSSHYLLSKVYRAKERLDEENPDEAKRWRAEHGDPTAAAQAAAEAAAAARRADGAGDDSSGGGGDSAQGADSGRSS